MMRRKGSECTRISPESTTTSEKPMISLASSSGRRPAASSRDRPKQVRGACGSRLLRKARCSAAKFYRRVRASVARALRRVSKTGSGDTTSDRDSRKQKGVPPPDDYHQSEAVEECIRFMNSSSRKYR